MEKGWTLTSTKSPPVSAGGYHNVRIGDTYRGYRVVSRLGWGFFSTVWLCSDLRYLHTDTPGGGYCRATGVNQKNVCQRSCDSSPRNVQLLDEFKVVGVKGVRIPFRNRLSLQKVSLLWSDEELLAAPRTNPRLHCCVSLQVLRGLDHLHSRCKIIHTDIKPENILLCLQPQSLPSPAGSSSLCRLSAGMKARTSGSLLPPYTQESLTRKFLCYFKKEQFASRSLKEVTVKISDLGSSCWVYKHFCEEIQTRQYRSLEVLLGSEYGPPTDIWSVACMAFELVTGDCLFRPKAGEAVSLEEDHIAQIVGLLGKIPPVVAISGKYSADYFSRRGDLLRVGPLRFWSLYDVLVEKYHFLLQEASGFSDFLSRMLDYNPERRATAAQCLQHAWLTPC
uniref:non-specific serine/threonine protein kinase n=1 Tax=Oryzias sinensis TaxID=183150 RepID=A0A8C7YBB3_9TELE